MQAGRGLHQYTEHSVDPVAYAGAVFLGLDVNITRFVADGRQHGHIDEIDDRAAFHHLIEIGGFPFIHRLSLHDFHIAV